jgi:3-oxoacyl-[acyl-carrier protein] reductase
VTELLGPLSILVNNAAHSTRDGYKALDAASLDAHYAVNLRATALLSVVFAQRFDGETGGRIVNLTSGQFLGPMPWELAYAPTKSDIEAITRTLASEAGHKGMTVNAVNPGPTDTGWMTEELKQELSAKFSARRVGEPEDAAQLAAFLASDQAAWITGQVFTPRAAFCVPNGCPPTSWKMCALLCWP